MKIKILDKYLFKQVMLATFVCILLFIIIWISPEILFKTIQRTLEGIYSPKMAIQIILFELPKILGKALPVGLLLGTLFTFDKLSKDSEITVLRGIGLSFWQILKAPLVFSIIISIFCFLLYDKFIPYTASKLSVIKHLSETSHFVYPVKGEKNELKRIIMVSSFDDKKIKDLIVLNFNRTQGNSGSLLGSILTSEYALHFDNEWILKNNTLYKIDQDGIFKEISAPKSVAILENKKAKQVFKLMQYSLKKDRELDNTNLFSYINLLKKEDLMDEYNFMLNKFIQRFVHSFICVLFTILGCLLGFSRPREQRLVGFTVAIGIIFLYYITMPCFDMFAEKGLMSPYLTAFLPGIGLLFAIYLIKKHKEL